MTVLIRKAWDMGVDKVSIQTVLQIDGDVMQVVAPLEDDQRAFLTALHRAAVRDGVGQWRTLFDVLVAAAKDLARALTRAI
ncbi:MAG: hypothetical protein ACJ8AW_04390 [Rhodopila sp.]